MKKGEGLCPNQHFWVRSLTLNHVSVGDVFSSGWALPNYSDYVSWPSADGCNGGIRGFDLGQLIGIHLIFCQKFFPFLLRDNLVFRHELVVEDVEGREDSWN